MRQPFSSLFLTLDNGVLTIAASSARLPIRTFAFGRMTSMHGTAFLVGPGEHRARKLMMSQTLTGRIPLEFPRQAASFSEVGDVRTNFAPVYVQSIALGRESLVKVHETPHGVLGSGTISSGM